jgi:hypothetical protein
MFPDVERPTLAIASTSPVEGTVGSDDATGTAVFPSMTPADNAPGVRAECKANINGVSTTVTSGLTRFPLGSTEVICYAVDTTGNPSAPSSFRVVIKCRLASDVAARGICSRVCSKAYTVAQSAGFTFGTQCGGNLCAYNNYYCAGYYYWGDTLPASSIVAFYGARVQMDACITGYAVSLNGASLLRLDPTTNPVCYCNS